MKQVTRKPFWVNRIIPNFILFFISFTNLFQYYEQHVVHDVGKYQIHIGLRHILIR